jgi:hypothetical protein
MNALFDEISRVVASNLSRRDAIKLIVGGLAGSYLSFLWPNLASAASKPRDCNTFGKHFCGGGCYCPEFTHCCIQGGPCCDDGYECCASDIVARDPGWQCCRPANTAGRRKDEGEVCCHNFSTLKSVCCDLNTHCCCRFERGQAFCSVKPAVQLIAIIPGPPPQLHILVYNPEGKPDSFDITATRKVNAEVFIPPVAKSPTLVVAVKKDPSKPAFVTLKACIFCGINRDCCTVGDPAVSQVYIPEGQIRVRESFSDIPAAESFITIHNGHPGFRRAHVFVNERHVDAFKMGPGEIKIIDVASEMRDTNDNVIAIMGRGRPGAGALIVIADSIDATKAARHFSPIQWDPGPQHPGLNLQWGL